MHPIYHAISSAKRWGGRHDDYLPIHCWFDETKAHVPDLRHRALRHHSEGIYLCEQVYGVTIINSAGRVVPVRQIGEQHVLEDLGRIPTAVDWLRNLRVESWMLRKGRPPGSSMDRSQIRAESLDDVNRRERDSQSDRSVCGSARFAQADQAPSQSGVARTEGGLTTMRHPADEAG